SSRFFPMQSSASAVASACKGNERTTAQFRPPRSIPPPPVSLTSIHFYSLVFHKRQVLLSFIRIRRSSDGTRSRQTEFFHAEDSAWTSHDLPNVQRLAGLRGDLAAQAQRRPLQGIRHARRRAGMGTPRQRERTRGIADRGRRRHPSRQAGDRPSPRRGADALTRRAAIAGPN